MVKLDVSLLRYMTRDDFRVLTSVEMGMKNHELVPASLVASISGLKGGGISKTLQELTKRKLLSYERGKRYDGYRLNYLGYDYLSLNVMRNRNIISQVGNQIGVGKESDVYVTCNDDGERFVLKIHRLGRTCFRAVTGKRDYTNGKVHNWIYMSRLAALREFSFMKALHEKGFAVPKPVECNRHCIVMELIPGTLMNHVTLETLPEPEKLYQQLMDMIMTMANEYGVVHGDFNEFNILIRDESFDPVLIDFPQMVATNHKFAREYFDRDVNCIVDFFKKRFDMIFDEPPTFDKDVIIDESKKPVIDIELEDLDLDDDEDVVEELESIKIEDKKVESLKIGDEKQEVTADDVVPQLVDSNDPIVSDDDDKESFHGSIYSITSRSTIPPEQIKQKLRQERTKDAKRERVKKSMNKIKGETSAVRRRKLDDKMTIKLDLKTHHEDGLF